MGVQWRTFEDRTAASRELATRLEADLATALAATDDHSAVLVVSGGSSPQALYRMLAAADLDWSRVQVLPSDERWVPTDHPDSNAGMIQRCLLIGPASRAELVFLTPEPGQDQVLEALNARLATLPRPFAHAVLGMGADGHTASLFPTAPDIEAALISPRHCLAQDVPGLSHPRISLTVGTLLEASRISVLAFGIDKRAVMERALGDGPARELPIRAILHQQQVPVDLYWAP